MRIPILSDVRVEYWCSLFTNILVWWIISVAGSKVNIDCNDGQYYIRADPESCDHFYMCDNGNPVRKECAPKTLYNPKTYNCDFPYNVQCTNDNKGTGSDKPNKGGQQSGNNKQQQNNAVPNKGGQPTGNNGQQQNTDNKRPANNADPNKGYNADPAASQDNTRPSGTEEQEPLEAPDNQSTASPSFELDNNVDNDNNYQYAIQNVNQNNKGRPSTTSDDDASDQESGERPRPTVDDLYSGDQHPYENYVDN